MRETWHTTVRANIVPYGIFVVLCDAPHAAIKEVLSLSPENTLAKLAITPEHSTLQT